MIKIVCNACGSPWQSQHYCGKVEFQERNRPTAVADNSIELEALRVQIAELTNRLKPFLALGPQNAQEEAVIKAQEKSPVCFGAWFGRAYGKTDMLARYQRGKSSGGVKKARRFD